MRPTSFRWSLIASSIWLSTCVACSNSGNSCSVSAPTECAMPAPTYADVAPIFNDTCTSSGCHTGQGKDPWSLGDYESVSDWQDLVRAELLKCSMPPPDSDVHLSDADRMKILNWVRCGALK